MLSVAITGLSDVASPLRPMTKSLPAARPWPGPDSESATTRTANRMAWITVTPPLAITTIRRSRRLGIERGIERIPQSVPEQVEAEHGDEDGEPGKGGDPPRRREELAPLDHHVAPAR